MDALAGPRKAAGLHHGDEASQQLEVEHPDQFKKPLEGSLSFNFQIESPRLDGGKQGVCFDVARPLGTCVPLSAELVYAQISLFCLIWSFAFVAGKIGVTYCPPLMLLTERFSLAGVLILGIPAVRRDAWKMTWRDAAVFAVLGIANNALYLGLGYTGLKTVSAGLGGLIISSNPVFTAVLAALVLGERLTWRKVLGLLLGITGVTMISGTDIGRVDRLHGCLQLAALASIVAGTILFKQLAPKGACGSATACRIWRPASY